MPCGAWPTRRAAVITMFDVEGVNTFEDIAQAILFPAGDGGVGMAVGSEMGAGRVCWMKKRSRVAMIRQNRCSNSTIRQTLV
jgi:hypothetical protein